MSKGNNTVDLVVKEGDRRLFSIFINLLFKINSIILFNFICLNFKYFRWKLYNSLSCVACLSSLGNGLLDCFTHIREHFLALLFRIDPHQLFLVFAFNCSQEIVIIFQPLLQHLVGVFTLVNEPALNLRGYFIIQCMVVTTLMRVKTQGFQFIKGQRVTLVEGHDKRGNNA